uniref:Mitochondrial splicing suppressor 51-like C-terminal domain-containing protein n=1 Tax=Grammatophora oceanica TaxID=210454 RepID=A0A7S1URY6_9STRA|mmetsp:Transcript_19658/g.29100  ORF Transcript_19658/g.29100 Transcript_19658/m.29100 type:complete len:184 (+) Transcript_19658:61-612(+)
MLERSLRIHVVGVEKELGFLDIFKEVGYLFPADVSVELVFVTRRDMLPATCNGNENLVLTLLPNLSVHLAAGTYGDDLDPLFDCGSGAPDMIIGLNAGLFAYESWRSVVTFLYEHDGVTGVFTDYNEHSAVNCASIGGSEARDSVIMNPFRQPLALPVYSQNLPQFSNGFFYVYNEQDITDID